ncbi:Global transcription regulator sge1 [Dictyocoela muelleri]|nr:Global transcription regulator sge1 [Dictyocoela muelleri]
MIKGYINSYEEALLMMHAIRLNLIKSIMKRPTDDMINSIDSGTIVCFISTISGIKRWRDSKIWSPHKTLNRFLLYKEVPGYLSKSAMLKKSPDERRESAFKKTEICGLYKKTISITYQNEVYHIISYERPIFIKHGLLDYPFFKNLKRALEENSFLRDDNLLKNMFIKNVRWYERFGILSPKPRNFRAEIDRKELEKNSVKILFSKFNFRQIKK